MSSIYTHGAIESMFDAEQTAAKLLDAVKANVEKTVKTVDAAVSLENKLSEEAAQFNACLTTMSNSIRKCERGEISRDEMLAECAPCVSTLKEKCVALKLANVEAKGTDITEEEIAMLKEYIVGCKDIVADHKQKLQDGEVEEKGASEGILSTLSDYEPATEANTIMEIRRSNEAKTARDLYVQAKKLYGLGSKDKAREYLKKSQKLYEQCLEKVKKYAKLITVERTTTIKDNYAGTSNSDKYTREATENTSAAYAIEYFEDRIDSCKALDLQWTNKAGKLNYSQTKAELKAERKALKKEKRLNDAKARVGKKAAKSASKAAKKYADAAYKEKIANATTDEEVEAIESIFETMYATESFAIETLAEYDLTQALEAEGDEAEVETGVSESEQKLRELYEQFNEAKAANDADKMNQLTGEINAVLDKIAKEAGDAYTEEDLKAADRKLAKGLAIGAAVVAAGTAIGIVGTKTGAFKKIAETAKAQAGKLRSNKGEDKGETKKGEGALNSLKTALAGLKGKFKKADKAEPAEPSTDSLIDGMTYAEFEASMESLMDSYELELAMESAMESDGEEVAGVEEAPKSASGLGARLRKAFGKLKKAKETGDEAAAADAVEEIDEVAEDLEEAAENAETPEQKKKLSKAAKIGIAAAATAAATVGAIVIATKAKKTSEGANVEPEKAASLMKQAAAAIKKASSAVKHEAEVTGATIKYAAGKAGRKVKGLFKKNATESFLADLAFGLESVCAEGDDVDEDEVENEEGKAFDDNGLIEEATESELEDLATEAAIAVMLAEDGIDDSDIE